MDAFPRSVGAASAWASPASRSSRASCSMERPLPAARMRRRRFVFSGSRRIVMLDIDCNDSTAINDGTKTNVGRQAIRGQILSFHYRERARIGVIARKNLTGITFVEKPTPDGKSPTPVLLRQPLSQTRIQLCGRTAAHS